MSIAHHRSKGFVGRRSSPRAGRVASGLRSSRCRSRATRRRLCRRRVALARSADAGCLICGSVRDRLRGAPRQPHAHGRRPPLGATNAVEHNEPAHPSEARGASRREFARANPADAKRTCMAKCEARCGAHHASRCCRKVKDPLVGGHERRRAQ
jgi:hypothetical protein